MAVTWTISRNGGQDYSLEYWGFKQCTITRRSLAVSEMVLVATVQSMVADPVFAFDDAIILYRNASPWFRGTVSQLPATGTSDTELQKYVVSDAWYKLQRVVYQQPYVFSKPDFTGLLGAYSSHVTLGQDPWGNKISSALQIQNICTFANVVSIATLPTLSESYLQDARDITCADAIRRILALTPDAVSWVDVNGILNISRRSLLPSVSVDLTDGTLVEALQDMTARNDLLVNGVVFVFITSTTDSATGQVWPQETRQTAGTTSGEAVIIATVELANQGNDTPESPPSGLAASYYACRNVLQWQGTLVLHEEECSGVVKVGNTLNLTNGRTAWASMIALVQQTTEDLFKGKTEVTFGPPEHLSPQDFIAMMLAFQKKNGPNDFSSVQHNGTLGVDTGDGGVGGDPNVSPGSRVANPNAGKPVGLFATVDVDACQAGSAVTLRVVGTVV